MFKQRGLIERSYSAASNIASIQEMDAHKNSVKQNFGLDMIDDNKMAAKLISNNIVTDAATVSSVHRLATENIMNNSTFTSLMQKDAKHIKSLFGANISTNLQGDIYRKYAGSPIPAYDGQGNIKFINEIKGSGYDVDHTIPIASLLPNGENYELFIKAVKHCNGNPMEAMKSFCRGEDNLNLLYYKDNRYVKNANMGSKTEGFNDKARAQQRELENISKEANTKNANKNVAKSITESALVAFGYAVAQQALTLVLNEVADTIMNYTGVLMYERHYDYSLAISEASTSNKIKYAFERKWNEIKHLISFENIKNTFTWENIKALFKTLLIQGASVLISSISSTARALVSSIDIFKNLFQAAKSAYNYYSAETYEIKHEALKDMRSYLVSALSAGLKTLILIIDKVAFFITLILNPLITMITAILIFIARMYVDVKDKYQVKEYQFRTYMDENF